MTLIAQYEPVKAIAIMVMLITSLDTIMAQPHLFLFRHIGFFTEKL